MTKEVFEKGIKMFGLMKMTNLMFMKTEKVFKEHSETQKEFEDTIKEFDKWWNEKVDF